MSKAKAKQPWFKFNPQDWRGDAKLRMCSIGARGLWMEMMCIMHEAEPYGHLLVGGRPPSNKQLAMLAGISHKECEELLTELELAGVFSKTEEGVIYSRRMIRDKAKHDKDRENGKTGGNPNLVDGVNGGVNRPDIPEEKGGVNPPDIPEDKAKSPESRVENIGGGVERAREQTAEPSTRSGKSPKSLISDAAFEIARDVLIAMGLEPEHPLSVGAPLTVQGWFNAGWNAECILIGAKRGMLSRNGDPPSTLKYFEKAIARAHAELTAPVPIANLKPQGSFDVTVSRTKTESLADVAKRHAESGIAFGPKPTGLPELESGPTVRLLPQG